MKARILKERVNDAGVSQNSIIRKYASDVRVFGIKRFCMDVGKIKEEEVMLGNCTKIKRTKSNT